MKKHILSIGVLAILASCEKPSDPPVQTAPVAKVTMTIDGTSWTSEKNSSAIVGTLSSDGTTDQVVLTGATVSGDNFQLSTGKDVNGPGTYTIPSMTGGAIQFWNSAKTYVVSSTPSPATITITGMRTINGTKYVKGTFSGWLRRNTDTSDKIEITAGEFNGIDP